MTAGAEVRPSSPAALRIRNLSKTFGGEQALKSVDLDVEPGEIHGLLGQNGSGKSTLIKILAGFHKPDPGGELWIGGERVALPLQPGEFRRYGISFVHQHLGLVPSLTVVENLFVGRLAAEARLWISWDRERAEAERIFREFHLNLDPSAVVAKLSPVERALLAIVRAVIEMRVGASRRHGGGLLVLDEPTPFLPRHDVDQLFRLMRGVVAGGASVIFVSHDVDEVLEITDRATVLRDGVRVGTVVTKETSKQNLIEMIVGRKFQPLVPQHQTRWQRAPSVAVEGLAGGTLDGLSIEVRAGEVIGLTGLIGSGFDEVPYLIFGAVPADRGALTIAGNRHDLTAMTPARAIAAGIVLIPADRQNAGAVGSLSVADNITLSVLDTAFKPWLLNRRSMLRRAAELVEQFNVRPNRPAMDFSALSGGNQQKVLLAKWLQTNPALILLDEPTQGVDVGARQQVFAAIERATTAGGASVLCASSDYEQLATICDRVLIFSRGRVVAQLAGREISKESISEHCYHSAESRLAS